jgi:hypothetical protein
VATSGTISTTTFETHQVIDEAFGRCKIAPQNITAEMIVSARNHLWLFLSSLPTRGRALWAQDKKLLALPLGQEAIATPVGTIDIRQDGLALRTLTRYTGTATSSAGGTAANAIDADLDTACTQTSANGSLTLDLGAEYTITTYGIAFASAGSYNLAFSTSEDNAAFTSRNAPGAVSYAAGLIQWYEIDPAIDCRYVKITESGGATLAIKEFIVGNTAQDIPLGRVGETSHITLPNRATRGRPSQFWLDRQHDVPIIHVWPTADATHQFSPLVMHRQRHVMDVGTLAQTLEAPQRWYDAVVANLALRLARYRPEVDAALAPDIKAEADEALILATADERDAAPMRMTVDVSAYTRR